MQTYAVSATDSDLLAAAREWINLLAAGRFADALAFLYRLPAEEWTPDYLARWIENYGFDQPLTDGSKMKATPTDSAAGTLSLAEVWRYDEIDEDTGLPLVARVLHDVPLDGEWSDLNAVFNVLRVDDSLVFDLYDLKT